MYKREHTRDEASHAMSVLAKHSHCREGRAIGGAKCNEAKTWIVVLRSDSSSQNGPSLEHTSARLHRSCRRESAWQSQTLPGRCRPPPALHSRSWWHCPQCPTCGRGLDEHSPRQAIHQTPVHAGRSCVLQPHSAATCFRSKRITHSHAQSLGHPRLPLHKLHCVRRAQQDHKEKQKVVQNRTEQNRTEQNRTEQKVDVDVAPRRSTLELHCSLHASTGHTHVFTPRCSLSYCQLDRHHHRNCCVANLTLDCTPL